MGRDFDKAYDTMARTRSVGHERIQDDAMPVAAAWNLMKMARLCSAT